MVICNVRKDSMELAADLYRFANFEGPISGTFSSGFKLRANREEEFFTKWNPKLQNQRRKHALLWELVFLAAKQTIDAPLKAKWTAWDLMVSIAKKFHSIDKVFIALFSDWECNCRILKTFSKAFPISPYEIPSPIP